jgi:hypothetical protein
MSNYLEKYHKFINCVGRFGAVDVSFVQVFFDIKYGTSLLKLRKMVEDNVLEKINKKDIISKNYFRLSNKYLAEFGYKKPKFRLSSFNHDIQVAINLITFSRNYKCDFLTEREIRSDLSLRKNKDKKTHYPDGALTINNELIAIEIELSKKSTQRLMSIFSWYNNQNIYSKVIYFCSKDVRDFIEKNATFLKTRLKIISID